MTLTLTPDPLPLVMDTQGTVRVRNSRVTLDLLVEAFESGSSPEEIVHQITTLDLGDIYAIMAFYLRHKAEVGTYVEKGRQESDDIRRKIESRWPPEEFRKRLEVLREAPKQIRTEHT
ncbi:MAG: DUF433 domain-containing protein [Chloroflexia bacterium]